MFSGYWDDIAINKNDCLYFRGANEAWRGSEGSLEFGAIKWQRQSPDSQILSRGILNQLCS